MSIQWPERSDILPFPPNGPLGGTFIGGGTGSSGFGEGPDSISLLGNYGTADSGTGLSMISQLMSTIQSLLSQMGYGGTSNSNGWGGSTQPWNEQHFTTASGGSVGDPHLSFNGSTWNDMNAEPNLLQSDSVHGGYQLSTQTTAPNAQGVTKNQQATVTSQNGQLQVSLNNAGQATITQNGYASGIAPGQTLQFGNETVACNADGSLTITNAAQNGGQITTTMSANDGGVDVNVSASNVNLGGALVDHNAPVIGHGMRRYD
jgi:hypothetical protein